MQTGSNALIPRPVRLALLGDVMLGRGVAQVSSAYPGERGELFELAPVLSAADLALANLESPITNASLVRRGYDLRADPALAAPLLEGLSESGLDVFSLANNHALDCGLIGLQATQTALKDHGLAFIGPDPTQLWRSVGGLRIAFLAFEDVTSPLDLIWAQRSVVSAAARADLVVISLHWGLEYRSIPTLRQRHIAQSLADAGADLIWGHHPHVLQPVEWLRGHGRSRSTLVAYSLGNALFDQVVPPEARKGAVLLVTLGVIGVQSVQAVPFEIDPFHASVSLATGEAASSIYERLGLTAAPDSR
ncbi:MAG TPA: CapA family protein [Anaerolineales bacterium]|nr:CapA family protein [Anaerolineales bacterium]